MAAAVADRLRATSGAFALVRNANERLPPVETGAEALREIAHHELDVEREAAEPRVARMTQARPVQPSSWAIIAEWDRAVWNAAPLKNQWVSESPMLTRRFGAVPDSTRSTAMPSVRICDRGVRHVIKYIG